MVSRRYLTLVPALFLTLHCNQKQVVLRPVRDLPEEFYQDKHFGPDLKSVYERNEFLLVTGGSDQIGQAVIAVDKGNIDLHLDSSRKTGSENFELYSGHGYQVSLTYTEYKQSEHTPIIFRGRLIVRYNDLKSTYDVVGAVGYH